jgi:hypothetical protein
MDVLGKTAWYRGAKNTAIIRWDVVGQGFPLGMKDTFSRLGHKQNSAFPCIHISIEMRVRKMGGVCNASRIAPNSHAEVDELSTIPQLFRGIEAQELPFYAHEGITCSKRTDMCRLARGKLGRRIEGM